MSGRTGVKLTKITNISNPTNKRKGEYVFEDGEWWYINAHDGNRRRASTAQAIQNSRMWVNGKYVPKAHPLHKGGRYKGFEQAAFSSLENYKFSPEGQVYVIINPAWPKWVKVGMAVDAHDRLKNYQTSSPFRDYKLLHIFNTDNRRQLEAKIHLILSEDFEQRNEWFKASVEQIKNKIQSIKGERHESIDIST